MAIRRSRPADALLRRSSLRLVVPASKRRRRLCSINAGSPSRCLGEGWWTGSGSNRRPRHCERRALSTELPAHYGAPVLRVHRARVNTIFQAISGSLHSENKNPRGVQKAPVPDAHPVTAIASSRARTTIRGTHQPRENHLAATRRQHTHHFCQHLLADQRLGRTNHDH